nr:ER membrane protein complex subunit 1-like [Ipomoea batatas]
MEKEPGDADVVFYRANLTFVDMEDAELLRIRMERTKAMHVISMSDGSTLRAWNLSLRMVRQCGSHSLESLLAFKSFKIISILLDPSNLKVDRDILILFYTYLHDVSSIDGEAIGRKS